MRLLEVRFVPTFHVEIITQHFRNLPLDEKTGKSTELMRIVIIHDFTAAHCVIDDNNYELLTFTLPGNWPHTNSNH